MIDRFARSFGATPIQRTFGAISTAAALVAIVLLMTGHQGPIFVSAWAAALVGAIGFNVARPRNG